MKRIIVIAGACLALSACANLAPAQSLDEQIAYAEGVVTSARQSAAQGLSAGAMPLGTAQQIEGMAEQADVLIAAARAAEGAGDASTAAGKLALATTILTQLQAIIPKGN